MPPIFSTGCDTQNLVRLVETMNINLAIIGVVIGVAGALILWIDWDPFSWYKRGNMNFNFDELRKTYPDIQEEYLRRDWKGKQRLYYEVHNVKFYQRMDMKLIGTIFVIIGLIIGLISVL